MATEFCPGCRTARTGSFRYCRSCGFDFDATSGFPPATSSTDPPVHAPTAAPASTFREPYAGAPLATAPADAPATDRQSSTRTGPSAGVAIILLAGLAAAVIGGVALSGALNARSAAISATANIPPVGEIWFGTSFNPTTFEISDRRSTVGLGAPVAMVAHLSRSIAAGQANMRLSLNGTVIANQAITNLQGGGDIVGLTTGAILMAGAYRYEITDIGGNDLASGSFTAAP